MRLSTRLALALTALLVLSPGTSSAQRRPPRVVSDTWQEPAAGVRYLRRLTSTPTQVHVIVVDLDTPGVALVATPHADRWSTVPEFGARHDLAVVINGGFWSTLQDPRGLAAGGGAVWPDVAPDPEFATFALDPRGRATVFGPDAPPDPETLTEAVSGRPVLVRDGEPAPELVDFPDAALRAPRTAVGVARRGRQLILVVVDGRQRDSRGSSLPELAALFVELGAESALNLDGGGSSEMYVRDAGVVNTPSRGRWEIAVDELLGSGEETRTTRRGTEVFVRGREREVMNHLGVVAPRADVAVRGHESDVGGLVPIEVPAPLPPRVRMGPFREVLARALVVGAPALALALALWGVLRARRAFRDRKLLRSPTRPLPPRR